MSITPDYQRDWPRYFEAVGGLGARDTLHRALAAHGPVDPAFPPLAIDVGCGEGRDTRVLLGAGWQVLAFDSSELGIQQLLEKTDPALRARLEARVLTFEAAAEVLPERAALINASFALPFCHPDAFGALWNKLCSMLAPGGLFAGQIFGDRDEWAPVRPGSHYSRTAMERLFADFDFVHLEEVEKDGNDALMSIKHHHLYHIVARKRSG
jgi:SAM-dependent methyltransferase